MRRLYRGLVNWTVPGVLSRLGPKPGEGDDHSIHGMDAESTRLEDRAAARRGAHSPPLLLQLAAAVTAAPCGDFGDDRVALRGADGCGEAWAC